MIFTQADFIMVIGMSSGLIALAVICFSVLRYQKRANGGY